MRFASLWRNRKNTAATTDSKPKPIIRRPDSALPVQCAIGQHLAAQYRVQRYVQQQARQHRRHRRGSFGVGVGQPVVHGHEADLGAVTNKQEGEGQCDDVGVESALHRVQVGPQQRASLGAEHLFGRHIQHHGAEQRLSNAHAAQNEVLPSSFQAGGRAVDADQQHGGQRRRFHCDPDDAHVVGRERQQHREAEQLVHAVVQAQPRWRHLAKVALHAHIGPRENRGRQADEGCQRDEEDVERVDVELAVPQQYRATSDDLNRQRAGRDEGAETEGDVDVAGTVAVSVQRQHRCADQRAGEQEGQCVQLEVQLNLPSAFPSGGYPGCRTARGSGT